MVSSFDSSDHSNLFLVTETIVPSKVPLLLIVYSSHVLVLLSYLYTSSNQRLHISMLHVSSFHLLSAVSMLITPFWASSYSAVSSDSNNCVFKTMLLYITLPSPHKGICHHMVNWSYVYTNINNVSIMLRILFQRQATVKQWQHPNWPL